MAPPHTRGWTQDFAADQHEVWGSPAHAGMDLRDIQRRQIQQRLPRTRGDGPARHSAPPDPAAAPPHTRGWTLR